VVCYTAFDLLYKFNNRVKILKILRHFNSTKLKAFKKAIGHNKDEIFIIFSLNPITEDS
jgi:hypothetical protein